MTPEIPNADEMYTYGYCSSCDTVHSLPVGTAPEHCLKIMEQIEREQRIDIDTPLEEADPHFSTDVLWGVERGQMFGVLVCENEQGEEVILKAFSCQHSGEWSCPGWVEPLVDSVYYLSRTRTVAPVIMDMTAQIKLLEKDSKEHFELKAKRRTMSREFMKELHGLYELHNFRGEKASLEEAFKPTKGIPTGTGDCCAPKLLNEAAKQGLKPKGLAEFFWGKENSSGTKLHRHFYSCCETKCQPILGFLLCGGTDD